MSRAKWAILIVTVSVRNDQFVSLVTKLLKQTEAYAGQIQVLAYWDNFEVPLGTIRQKLVAAADAEYINFLDDDDEIPDYYCDEVFPLLDGVDYVGWQMQAYTNGERLKPTYHSLRYTGWSDDELGFYRNVSHLNPIKKELAMLGSFERAVPEDHDWAQQVMLYVKTEHYIDKVMYHYRHDVEGSLWNSRKRPLPNPQRPQVEHKNFKWMEISNGDAD